MSTNPNNQASSPDNRDVQRLAWFIRDACGFDLVIGVVGSDYQLQQITDSVVRRLPSDHPGICTVHADESNQESLFDTLDAASGEIEQSSVVFAVNLHPTPAYLAGTNFLRDALPRRWAKTIVFWVSHSALSELISRAPDFWDWRISLFRFHDASLDIRAAIESSIQVSEQAGDEASVFDATLKLADWFEEHGQMDQSREALSRLWEMAESRGDRDTSQRIGRRIGQSYRRILDESVSS